MKLPLVTPNAAGDHEETVRRGSPSAPTYGFRSIVVLAGLGVGSAHSASMLWM